MARTKSTVSTTSTVENENINVEAAETTVETTEKKETVKTVKTEKKNKSEKVLISNPKSALQKIRVCREVYSFDNEGKALVSAADSELFLKLPGYELV